MITVTIRQSGKMDQVVDLVDGDDMLIETRGRAIVWRSKHLILRKRLALSKSQSENLQRILEKERRQANLQLIPTKRLIEELARRIERDTDG